jgi:hypothetical protein
VSRKLRCVGVEEPYCNDFRNPSPNKMLRRMLDGLSSLFTVATEEFPALESLVAAMERHIPLPVYRKEILKAGLMLERRFGGNYQGESHPTFTTYYAPSWFLGFCKRCCPFPR